MVSLFMSYMRQNMKLFANKLGKLELFWLFDYSFTKTEKLSPAATQQIPSPNFFYVARGAKLSIV